MILTSQEVADLLRISMPTLLEQAAYLGGFKVGRSWRFSSEKLEEIVGEPIRLSGRSRKRIEEN